MNLGPFVLYWLHRQTADFKEKYIRSMVNIAAPWGGAIKALRLMASGDNIDVRFSQNKQLNLLIQSFILGICCFTNSCSFLSTFRTINCICYAKSEFLG